MKDDPRVRDILDRATELPAEQRPAFLDSACGSDTALRAEVESLLRSLDSAGEFLQSPTITASGANSTAAPGPGVDDLGTTIGPYRLIKVIGEGGMGVVLPGRAGSAGATPGGIKSDQARHGHRRGDCPVSKANGRRWR